MLDGIPASFHQLPSDVARRALGKPSEVDLLPGCLVCVRIIMLNKGVPSTRARIYRLPTSNNELRGQWLGLIRGSKTNVCISKNRQFKSG
jgi:ribonuclease P/MRP protein subunit POP1